MTSSIHNLPSDLLCKILAYNGSPEVASVSKKWQCAIQSIVNTLGHTLFDNHNNEKRLAPRQITIQDLKNVDQTLRSRMTLAQHQYILQQFPEPLHIERFLKMKAMVKENRLFADIETAVIERQKKSLERRLCRLLSMPFRVEKATRWLCNAILVSKETAPFSSHHIAIVLQALAVLTQNHRSFFDFTSIFRNVLSFAVATQNSQLYMLLLCGESILPTLSCVYALIPAAQYGRLELMQTLLGRYCYSVHLLGAALQWAAHNGHYGTTYQLFQCMRQWLASQDTAHSAQQYLSCSVKVAATGSHNHENPYEYSERFQIIRLLATGGGSFCILFPNDLLEAAIGAVNKGRMGILRQFLEYGLTQEQCFQVACWAAKHGKLDSLPLLLPRVGSVQAIITIGRQTDDVECRVLLYRNLQQHYNLSSGNGGGCALL